MKWKAGNGQELDVKEMTTRHIENALALLKRRGYVSPSTVAFYVAGPEPCGDGALDAYAAECEVVMEAPTSPFIDLFEEELERREVTPHQKRWGG